MTEQDCTVEAHAPTWKERFSDWCRRMFTRRDNSSEMTSHAMRELTQAGFFDADSDYDGMLGPAVLRLVQTHAKENHSGFSSSIALSLFERVVRGEPLSPLTGEEKEWSEWYEGEVRQNLRCSKIFQRKDGTAYTLDAVIFLDPNGASFTSKDSIRDIEFPYMPPARPEYQHNPPQEVIPQDPVKGTEFMYKGEYWVYDGEYWVDAHDYHGPTVIKS